MTGLNKSSKTINVTTATHGPQITLSLNCLAKGLVVLSACWLLTSDITKTFPDELERLITNHQIS